MIKLILEVPFIAAILLTAVDAPRAQQLSVPQVTACNNQYVGGKMTGSMPNRTDASHTGQFQVTVDVRCENGKARVNNLEIHPANLTDTVLKGAVHTFQLDQLTSLGKAAAPTVFLGGPCKSQDADIAGCQLWLMLVDNGTGETRDVVSFIVVDGMGKRLAYGTGLVTIGDVRIDDKE
jgi:hypothetical protein